MRTAVIGGGAAGFFLAINLKEMMPEMEVTIFERASRVLRKVEISGGGRCNCTNSFEGVKELSAVYPRGHRLMKRLMKGFSHRDAYEWMERHGVPLTTQDDHCVFPVAQDSHAVIDCFLSEARRHRIRIVTGCGIHSVTDVAGYDFVAVATGGSPKGEGLEWLHESGHDIVPPVPSLFTFNIADEVLHELMGTVVGNATAFLSGVKYRSQGALLITHWGMSGPAILKLSSHAARLLADNGYRMPLCINWVSRNEAEIHECLESIGQSNPQKQVHSYRPFALPQRLWEYLSRKALGDRATAKWASLTAKDTNRLVNILSNDTYAIDGRGTYKDEFVTCGGISLQSVDAATLESKHLPGLYFAGEVLDIDGITGGFNFQAAWTTAYTVAQAIAARVTESGDRG